MKDFTINDIDIKYRVPFQGEYMAVLSRCLNCELTEEETNFQFPNHCIGFAAFPEYEKRVGFSDRKVVIIFECPKCGSHYYCHASPRTYIDYINSIS